MGQTGQQAQDPLSQSLCMCVCVWYGWGRVGRLFLLPGHWVARAKGIKKGFWKEVIPELCQLPGNKAETLATAARSGVHLSVSVETALSLD